MVGGGLAASIRPLHAPMHPVRSLISNPLCLPPGLPLPLVRFGQSNQFPHNTMLKTLALVALATLVSVSSLHAADNPMVGGAPMLASKDIVDNAVNSKDHTTLVAAVKAAGLVDTLKGKGPFTVFAPTNAAFSKIPASKLESLMKPENKEKLARVLTFHVVPGALKASDLAQKIKDGGGKAKLQTVQGGNLTASMNGDKIVLADNSGNTATVTIADVIQSNGVIHVVDGVLKE